MNRCLPLLAVLFIGINAQAQRSPGYDKVTTDSAALQQLLQDLQLRDARDAEAREVWMQAHPGAGVLEIDEDRTVSAFIRFAPNGHPIFYQTDNADAAETVGTDLVHPGGGAGYSLTGQGINIGEWDGGEVRDTHVEFGNRVTQIDNPSSLSDHATHVAGTMIAAGTDPDAKGMAYQATVDAHDFFSDEIEMASFAATNEILSNHSYGRITGWRFHSSSGYWRWYGDTTLSATEDYAFGFYTFTARIWDTIAHSSPYYLIVKSAGNDRNDAPPVPLDTHMLLVGGVWTPSTVQRPGDCPTGYDCISSSGNAKNILTVGAVGDISGGYSQPSDVVMSSFSGWGPTDDGRIKPDLVANGISLYSTGSSNNTDYYNSSGTSMSAPNATGSLALIQKHYEDEFMQFMPSSALKALVLHTADEAGTSTGPDYTYGWGLLNTRSAVDLISDTISNRLTWDTLMNNDSLEWLVYSNGTVPLRATICWTDPAGTPPSISLDPTTSMLVNDLDLRVEAIPSGNTSMPYILNPAMPSMAATTGDNVRDNVEQVYIASPTAGFYRIKIRHKGSLSGGQQVASLVVSGLSNAPQTTPPVVDFTASDTTICVGDTVQFTDLTTNLPTGWQWTLPGATGANLTAQNPQAVYTSAGTFMAKLVATNAFGSDSLTKMAYIQVDSLPIVDFTFLTDVCDDAGQIGLNNFVTPVGGTFSGPGVSGNLFFPQTAGLGSHTLVYTYTTAGGCVVSDPFTTTVVAAPVVTHPSSPPVCSTASDFMLSGGSPAGGTYSGTGIMGGTMFSPGTAGVGVHAIVYSFTNAGGCTDTAQFNITVVPGATASFAPLSPACVSGGLVSLSGGSPAGGAYGGLGVDTLNGTFDPAIAGVGQHTLTYFANVGGCIANDTSVITVLPDPTVQLTVTPQVACAGSPAVALSGGMPMGGTYSGPGVTAGQIDPSVAGVGLHTITYTYTDGNGCVGTATDVFEVSNSVSVSLPDSGNICANSPAFVLNSGMPMGGTYSGPGMIDTVTFSPSSVGAGSYDIVYTYNQNGCTGSDTATFTVVDPPTVAFANVGQLCVSQDSLILSGGTPAGGTYSGPGVTNGVFYPSQAGPGAYLLTYTYTGSTGCTNSAFATVQVVTGNASFTGLDPIYCLDDPMATLSGAPAGGTFVGSGISGSTFDPSVAGVGQHTIAYQVTAGCPDTAVATVEVVGPPTIALISGPATASQNGAYTYFVTANNGASYAWNITGGTVIFQNNNVVQVQWGSGIQGTLTAIEFNDAGCSDTTSMTVNLWPLSSGPSRIQDPMSVFPNPGLDHIYVLNLPSAGRSSLRLFDMGGRQVMTRSIDPGLSQLRVEVGHLPRGSYIVWYESEGYQWSSQVILQ